MIRQSQAIVLLLCAALGSGCGSDEAIGPDASGLEQASFSVRVSPSEAALLARSGSAVQLWVEAFDETAKLLPGSYPIVYSSSAPQIANVSGDGIVTGVAPGTATITAAVTIGGATRTATTRVFVAESPLDRWRIAGTYDLTATVTLLPYLGEPGGGPPYQVIAVLTFPSGSNAPTFTDLRVVDEAGDPVYWVTDGAIRLNVESNRALFGLGLGTITAHPDDAEVSYWNVHWGVYVQSVEEPGEDTAASPLIEGSLGGDLDGQWYGGPFVATLRGSTPNGG